jgi:hypothetical protein
MYGGCSLESKTSFESSVNERRVVGLSDVGKIKFELLTDT